MDPTTWRYLSNVPANTNPQLVLDALASRKISKKASPTGTVGMFICFQTAADAERCTGSYVILGKANCQIRYLTEDKRAQLLPGSKPSSCNSTNIHTLSELNDVNNSDLGVPESSASPDGQPSLHPSASGSTSKPKPNPTTTPGSTTLPAPPEDSSTACVTTIHPVTDVKDITMTTASWLTVQHIKAVQCRSNMEFDYILKTRAKKLRPQGATTSSADTVSSAETRTPVLKPENLSIALRSIQYGAQLVKWDGRPNYALIDTSTPAIQSTSTPPTTAPAATLTLCPNPAQRSGPAHPDEAEPEFDEDFVRDVLNDPDEILPNKDRS
ncbi:hypothetical protein Pelo_14812 [Pelomyxa schiedti]|nr:hypothetical protein Pelo_14812 [Pelomyxa schiedti]